MQMEKAFLGKRMCCMATIFGELRKKAVPFLFHVLLFILYIRVLSKEVKHK